MLGRYPSDTDTADKKPGFRAIFQQRSYELAKKIRLDASQSLELDGSEEDYDNWKFRLHFWREFCIMLVLVSYDIKDDKTRTRLAKKLLDFGPRVQFSVFEADVSSKELTRLKQMLGKVKLGERDSIRLYNLCETCFGKVTKDKEIYIA